MDMLTHPQQRVVLAAIGLLLLGCAVKAWHPRVPSMPPSPPHLSSTTSTDTPSDTPTLQGDLPNHSTPQQ